MALSLWILGSAWMGCSDDRDRRIIQVVDPHEDGGGTTTEEDGGSNGNSSLYHLEVLASPGPLWTQLFKMLAVDSSERVFVSNSEHVFSVLDGEASVYLSQETLGAAFGGSGISVKGLDVGPDDKLYVLAHAQSGEIGDAVLVSQAAGSAALHVDVSPLGQTNTMSVADADHILILDSKLYLASSTGRSVLSEDITAQWPVLCDQSLMALPDGFFFYLKGGTKSGSPASIWAASISDPSLEVLLTHAQTNKLDAWQFSAFGREDGDHVIVNMSGRFRRVHRGGGSVRIDTDPDLDDFAVGLTCEPLTVGPSGIIYFLGQSGGGEILYRAVPENLLESDGGA